MYTLSPHVDCNIVGGDTQNHESLQPIRMTGHFGYHISCNGTIVAVNATGFCVLTERTDKHALLSLIIYREDNGILVPTSHYINIPADCEVFKNNSVSGIDYSLGSVSDNDLNIPVTSGEFLSIAFFTKCKNSSCPFQPAIINEPSKHTLLFLEFGKKADVANTKNVSLLFSATIETPSDKRGKNAWRYLSYTRAIFMVHF